MDNYELIMYRINMLTGIRIYSSDETWRHILADLNAVVTDTLGVADVDFDSLDIVGPISVMDLKKQIISALDYSDVIRTVFGRTVSLSRIQTQIIVCLYRSGGMSGSQLKGALGYAPDANTHSVDTAIYQLRKVFGREFIKNIDGIYRIGEL